MEDVPFDPVPVFNNFNTSGSGGTGDSAGRDRSADLGYGFRTPLSAGLKVMTVLRCSDRRASGRSRSLASRNTRSRPTPLMQKLLPALRVMFHDAMLRGRMPDNATVLR